MSMRLKKLNERVIQKQMEKGILDKAATLERLEAFCTTGALTSEEYMELVTLVDPEAVKPQDQMGTV